MSAVGIFVDRSYFRAEVPPEDLWRLCNMARFCTGCGEVWARRIRRNEPFWTVERYPCAKCPPINDYTIPGSLGDWDFELPDELLERELLLLLKDRNHREPTIASTGIRTSIPLDALGVQSPA